MLLDLAAVLGLMLYENCFDFPTFSSELTYCRLFAVKEQNSFDELLRMRKSLIHTDSAFHKQRTYQQHTALFLTSHCYL